VMEWNLAGYAIRPPHHRSLLEARESARLVILPLSVSGFKSCD
jgi:hypothetical protein